MAFKMKAGNKGPMYKNFGIGNSPLQYDDLTTTRVGNEIGNRLTNVDTKKPPTNVKYDDLKTTRVGNEIGNRSKYHKSTSRFSTDAKFAKAKRPKMATGKVKPMSVSRAIKGVGRRTGIGLAAIAAYEGGKYLYDKYKENKKKNK